MTPAKDPASHGALAIAAASVLWALGYLVRKTVLPEISGLSLTLYTSLTVTLFFILVFRPSARAIAEAFREAPGSYLSLSFFGVVVGTTAMFLGLCRLPLGVALLLEKLQPLFTAAAARIFLGERLDPRVTPFILIALASSYFVSFPDPFSLTFSGTDPAGVIFIVIAAASWGISSVIGRSLMLRTNDARMVTLLRFMAGAMMLSPIVLVPGTIAAQDFTALNLGAVLFVAVVSTGSGYLLFYYGLRTVAASVSGFLELLTPIVGLFLGIVLLEEPFTKLQLLAAFILLCAVYRIAVPRRSAKPGE